MYLRLSLRALSIIDSPDKSIEWPGEIANFPPVSNTRQAVQYRYFIRRTKSNNLPVYQVTKHGGSQKITEIRHVEGDPRVRYIAPIYSLFVYFYFYFSFSGGVLWKDTDSKELLIEIENGVGIERDKISYNPVTRRIVIKGCHIRQGLMELLSRLGF